MKFVKRYMKPCAALILFTLFLKLVSAALDLMIPRILATMIDEIAPSASAGRILNAGIAMIVMAVLSLLSNVKGNIQSAEIAKRITGSSAWICLQRPCICQRARLTCFPFHRWRAG